MRIFISYGHDEHISFARKLYEALIERGHEVWFDEEKLKAGCRWEEYIENGLKWISNDPDGKLILIMTPHSVRRPDGYCLNELAYALDLRLDILPVMLVWTTPPLSIYRYQWLDLTDRKGETQFADDFRKIITSLENNVNGDDSDLFYYLRNNLEPLNFLNDISLYQPDFIGREWIMSDFDKWLNENRNSRVYFITGLPGVGKTALSVHMLQTCNNIVAFHLCRKGNSEKTSLRRAICSIAYQLSRELPEYQEHLLRVNIVQEKDRCNDDALFDVLIAGPLSHCGNGGKDVLILIDGIDEAGDCYHSPFSSFLARNMEKLPQWVRFVLTSRPEDAVLHPLQEFSARVLHADSPENISDIKNYINKRLSALDGACSFDTSLITERSEGIFLYAKYVCNELISHTHESQIRYELPAGISAIYYDFFNRNFTDIGHYRNSIRPFLDTISAQVEPLSIDRLSACCDKEIDEVIDFLALFKSMIYVGDDDKIRPYHTSFIDWITDRKKSGIYVASPERGTENIFNYLTQIFKESGWDFFMEGEDADFLIRWYPEILGKIKKNKLDADMLVERYNKSSLYKNILKDLLPDRIRFHFIKSVFAYAFRHTHLDKGALFGRYSEGLPDCYTENMNLEGLKYLFDHIRTGQCEVPSPILGKEYYYFWGVQVPLLYVYSSFDTEEIFRTLASGIHSACEDGRISTIRGMLSYYYDLATDTFKESAAIAATHLDRIASHDIYMNDVIARCAGSIRKITCS